MRLESSLAGWAGAMLAATVLLGSNVAAESLPEDHAARMREGLATFKQHVRPVLIEHCVKCHGGESLKSQFNLTTRAGLIRGGDVGAGITVGSAEQSSLYRLITHQEEPFMPARADRLPAATIARIAAWIDLGAPYDVPLVGSPRALPKPGLVTDEDRAFWSFRPLAAVDPPEVKRNGWVRTPVDQFIVARHEELGIHGNAPADRRTLIRRVTLDLVGLPPTPEEIEAFVADSDPQAYERLIDGLLASQHFGERWARHWMDIARFAESHGYEQDYDRPHAYLYRDFLIRALNDDMPFDQFARWQLAGDELAPEDPYAMTATGFLGAGVFPTQLTEMEFESARYDELDDMVATTGVAFLGLSVGCARCHDHKFDPISTRSYYRLAASFGTTIRSEIELDFSTGADRARLATHQQRLEELEADLQRYEQEDLPARLRAFLAATPPEEPSGELWRVLEVGSHGSTGESRFARQPDGSLLATGSAPAKEVLTLVARTRQPRITAFRLEALTHESLPHHGPGRAANGNFALGDFQVTATPLEGDGAPVAVELVAARATHQQNTTSLSVAASIDSDPISGWAVDFGGIGKDQAAAFEAADPVGFPGGTQLTFTLVFNHPNSRHSMGRLRLSVTGAAPPVSVPGQTGAGEALLEALDALRKDFVGSAQHLPTAIAWFSPRDAQAQELQAAIDTHRQAAPPGRVITAQVSSEGFEPLKHHADDRGFPHFYPRTHVLARGDVNQKQAVATQSFLEVLMRDGKDATHWRIEPPEGWTRTSFRRASLASWITDERHGAGPLLARVIVNRLWQHHFGRGIVATPNDFGFQGEPPTHPELLDWLAHDLIEHGWKLKRLHKLMLRSSVYIQSGDHDEARADVDRENLYLWRRAPRRLEGEALRDSMLHVAGLLDRRMYGAGTLDQNMRRRSIYFFIKRSKLIPVMMLFDWPEHLVSIGRRSVTTSAPQALALMNSTQGRQYAEALARRLAGKGGETAVTNGYRLALGRAPDDDEKQIAISFLAQQGMSYQRSGQPDPENLALVDFCQTLLSLNELVYVR